MAIISCPGCGRDLSDESDRCPDCGFRLGRYHDRGSPVRLEYCPRCRRFLPYGLKKCPRCGREPAETSRLARKALLGILFFLCLVFLFAVILR